MGTYISPHLCAWIMDSVRKSRTEAWGLAELNRADSRVFKLDNRRVRDRKARTSPTGMGWGGSRRAGANCSDEEHSGGSEYSYDDQERHTKGFSKMREPESQKRVRKSHRSSGRKSHWSLNLYESLAGVAGGGRGASRDGPPRTRLRRKDYSSKNSRHMLQGACSSWVLVFSAILFLAYFFDVFPTQGPGLLSNLAQSGTGSTGSLNMQPRIQDGKTRRDKHSPVYVKTAFEAPGREHGALGADPTIPGEVGDDPDKVKAGAVAGGKSSHGINAPAAPSENRADISRPTSKDHEAIRERGRSGIPKAEGGGIVPMSGHRSDLHVPGGSGRMDVSTVRAYYRKLARGYLSTFAQGIYRHMFFDMLRRRTYSLTPPGANKGVQSMMIQIIDKKVYLMDPYEVPKNSKPFYRKRINEIIWLLSKMSTAGRIKNTEFMVSIHDCVQTVNKPHTYRAATYQESIPAFTIVSCNFSDNIPFPMWEGDATRGGGFAGWDKRMLEYATRSQQAWETKDSKAVFRGGNRPSMFFKKKEEANKHCNEVGRTRLSYLASENPGELDVSVGGTCGGVHRYLQRLDENAQQAFKYVVYAEGNCFWADRLNKQVFGPSLIIKQDTPCGQFWEPLLKPMTHYLPTDFHFDNLVDQIKWARKNDESVQEMIRNANDFAHNFLTLQGIETYIEVLLHEYTNLLVEPDVKLESGAVEVTNKHV